MANECTHALLFLGDELLRALSEFVLHYETHGFPVRQDRRTVNESHFSIALVGFFYAVLVDAPDRDAGRSGIALERSFCSIKLVERIRGLAADGVHHIVEVAFGANIKTDTEVLAQGGSISTYATNTPMPETPVWQLVFVNARLFFVGSDDVPAEAKIEATRDINKALEAGWQGLDIAETVPLDQIARAHELVEHPAKPGRVIVAIT